MNKKILVTAFEPFGGHTKNSSVLLMEKLKPIYNSISVKTVVLPVLYKDAFLMLKKEIDSFQPELVICIGQAGGRQKIAVERVAVNINNSTSADNGRIIKTDELIIKNGPDAYFTNLPHETMISTAKEHAVISYSAGTYICNDIFYRLMHYININRLNLKGGFIHLPYTEHFDKMPFIDLETQLSTVEAMLAVLGDYNEY